MRALHAGMALLLTACTSSGLSESAPSPVRAEVGDSWTVELSTAPTLLAVAPEQVYVASYGNGVGGSQVYRVDRSTGVREEQRTLAGQPNGMALAPDGTVWIATLRLPDQPTGTGLQVLDGDTLETRRAVAVDEEPLSLAMVGADLWVGFSSGVRRYDDATESFGPLVPTPTPAYRMVHAGPGLLVVGPSAAVAVDVDTATVVGAADVPAFGSVVATGGGEEVWLAHPDAQAASVLQRYDPTSLQPTVTAPSPGRAGAGIALTDEALWVVDSGTTELRCADPRSGEVRSVRTVPGAMGTVAADAESVFVALPGGLAALPAEC